MCNPNSKPNQRPAWLVCRAVVLLGSTLSIGSVLAHTCVKIFAVRADLRAMLNILDHILVECTRYLVTFSKKSRSAAAATLLWHLPVLLPPTIYCRRFYCYSLPRLAQAPGSVRWSSVMQVGSCRVCWLSNSFPLPFQPIPSNSTKTHKSRSL